MSQYVEIVEMAARDGLQNEKQLIPTSRKIELINQLSACGFKHIEATSFVSPKWVPQLADATQLMAGIQRYPAIQYSVLVPNMKGYELAIAAQADEIAIFISASEGFSHANINCSVAESLNRVQPIIAQATADRIAVRGYISCVVECPYDGQIAPSAVAILADRLSQLGCYQISLGDTTGHGTPHAIGAMLESVVQYVPASNLAGHYHDTDARALDNIRISLDMGLRVFDASAGGLGGCPYAPGAKGNVDSLSVYDLVHSLGFETGLDREKLAAAAGFARSLVAETSA